MSNRADKRHVITDKVIEEKVAQRLAPDYWNWVYPGEVSTPKDQVKILRKKKKGIFFLFQTGKMQDLFSFCCCSKVGA